MASGIPEYPGPDKKMPLVERVAELEDRLAKVRRWVDLLAQRMARIDGDYEREPESEATVSRGFR